MYRKMLKILGQIAEIGKKCTRKTIFYTVFEKSDRPYDEEIERDVTDDS